MTAEGYIVITLLLGFGFLAAAAGLLVITRRHNREIKALQQELLQERQRMNHTESERRGLSGQLEAARRSLSGSERRIYELEGELRRRQAEVDQRIGELHQARLSLEQERQRIIEEDQRKRKLEEENRTRLWALHEQETQRKLRELCGRSELSFLSFDNSSLPGDFDASLKPDFMIRFLDQYVIFDAKHSASQNLSGYIAGQAQLTARKLSRSAQQDQFYPRIFFVIPSLDIGALKTLSFYEGGYHFHCICPESLEAVLVLFKLLEQYEFAASCNPQDREHIVRVIAALQQQIRYQNAVNVISSFRGIQALSSQEVLDSDMRRCIDDIRRNMRIENFTPSQLKRLIQDEQALREELLTLVTPQKASVEEEDMDEAKGY